jgi:hypothetical protein
MLPNGLSITARRAVRDDEAVIEELVSREKQDYITKFGPFSVAHLIETAVLSITVVDEQDNIVGFASFLDAPPVGLQYGALAQDRWPSWFTESFDNEDCPVDSSLWCAAFVASESIADVIAGRVLHTVFATLHWVDSILALLPLEVPLFSPIRTRFHPLPLRHEQYFGPQAHVCRRAVFIPPLRVRRARIEDHDDLVPVLNRQSEVLTSIYGEFFLATLIESQDAHNVCLVAEVAGRAVGLLCVTDDIDVTLLNECFQLEPYDFLVKNPRAVAQAFAAPALTGPVARASAVPVPLVGASFARALGADRRLRTLYPALLRALCGLQITETPAVVPVPLAEASSTALLSPSAASAPVAATPGDAHEAQEAARALTATLSSAAAAHPLWAADAAVLPHHRATLARALATLAEQFVAQALLGARPPAPAPTAGDVAAAIEALNRAPAGAGSSAASERAAAVIAAAKAADSVGKGSRRPATAGGAAAGAGAVVTIGLGAPQPLIEYTEDGLTVVLPVSALVPAGVAATAGAASSSSSSSTVSTSAASETSPLATTDPAVGAALDALEFLGGETLSRDGFVRAVTAFIATLAKAKPPAQPAPGTSGAAAGPVAAWTRSALAAAFISFLEEAALPPPAAAPAPTVDDAQMQALVLARAEAEARAQAAAALSAFGVGVKGAKPSSGDAAGGPEGSDDDDDDDGDDENVDGDDDATGTGAASVGPASGKASRAGRRAGSASDAGSRARSRTGGDSVALSASGGSDDAASASTAAATPLLNAVAVVLYCLDESLEARGADLVGPAFAFFPDKEYCAVTLPYTCEEHALLHHFAPVPARPQSTLSHALYLLHRDALGASVAVAWAAEADLPDAAALLSYMDLPPGLDPVLPAVDASADAAAASVADNGAAALPTAAELGLPAGSRAAALMAQLRAALVDDHLQRAFFLQEKEARRAARARAAAMPRPHRAGSASSAAAATTASITSVAAGADAEAVRAEEALDYETVRPARRSLGAFTIRCEGHLVGFALALARPPAAVDALSRAFAADEYVTQRDLLSPQAAAAPADALCVPGTGPTHGDLLALVLNPLFKRHTSRVCRELLRLFRKQVLVFRAFPGAPVDDVLSVFVQLRPSAQPLQAPDVVTLAPDLSSATGPAGVEAARAKRAAAAAAAGQAGVLSAGAAAGGAGAAAGAAEAVEFDTASAGAATGHKRGPGGVAAAGSFADAATAAAAAAAAAAGYAVSASASAALTAESSLLCPVYLLSRKLLSLPRAPINARIVVVGASDTGLAFLEAIVLNPDLHCTSVTLVAPEGLPTGRPRGPSPGALVAAGAGAASPAGAGAGASAAEDDELSHSFLPASPFYDAAHLARLGLGTRVRVVRDRVAGFDAAAQSLRLLSGASLPYDALVLATGLRECSARRLDVDELATQRADAARFAAALLLPGEDVGAAAGGDAQQQQQAAGVAAGGKQQSRAGGRGSTRGDLGSAPPGSSSSSSSAAASGVGADAASGFDLSPHAGPVSGIMSISTAADARALLAMHAQTRPRVTVIYGCTLRALTALQGLLAAGVPPAALAWAHPHAPASAAWCHGDKAVAERALQAVASLGVAVFPHARLAAVRADGAGALAQIVLHQTDLTGGHSAGAGAGAAGASSASSALAALTRGGLVEDEDFEFQPETPAGPAAYVLACQRLVVADAVDADPYIFGAAAANSLVFDGRLVVDHGFRACGAPAGNLYAAGPLCRFSRVYGRTLPQEQYCSREVGRALAAAVLRSLDPALAAEARAEEEAAAAAADAAAAAAGGYADRSEAAAEALRAKAALLPQLGQAPKVDIAVLPGGLHYLHAALPPPAGAAAAAAAAAVRPKELLSTAGDRVCRLVFAGQDMRLRTLTYVGADPVQAANLIQLVGLPATYLNSVVSRFEAGAVPDLLAYLQQSWATALYHEGFPELRAACAAALQQYMADAEASGARGAGARDGLASLLAEALADKAGASADGVGAKNEYLSLIARVALHMPVAPKHVIQTNLLQFITDNADALPGYVIPAAAYDPVPAPKSNGSNAAAAAAAATGGRF